jgi:4-amino-4-deoxy-L-arabinose transferase-like glycosyltransferase
LTLLRSASNIALEILLAELSSTAVRDCSRKAWVVLVCILALAAGLRIHRLTTQSLWLDELWYLEVAMGHASAHGAIPYGEVVEPANFTQWDSGKNFVSVWKGLDDVTSPPLSPVVERLWAMGFGRSEAGLRSFSVVCSLVGILLLYLAARHSFGTEGALWACALMATAGPQIRYAQEARVYSLLLVLGLLAILLVQRIQIYGINFFRAVGLTLTLCALLLAHYFSIGALAAVFVYAILQTRGKIRLGLCACVIGAGLLFTGVWGPAMIRQIPRFAANDPATQFLRDAGPGHIRRTVVRLVKMPISLLSERPFGWVAIVGGLFFYAVAVVIWIRRSETTARIWIYWFVGVVGLLFVLDFSRATMHLNYIRYPLLASAAVYAILSVRPAGWLRFLQCAVPALALVLCLATVRRAYVGKTEYRELGQAISARCRADDLIVFAGEPGSNGARTLYLGAEHYGWPLPGSIVLLDSPASVGTMQKLSGRRRVWLACGHALKEPGEWLPGYRMVSQESWPRLGRLIEMVRNGE